MVPYTKFVTLAVITSVLVFAATVSAIQAATAATNLNLSRSNIYRLQASPETLAQQVSTKLDQIIKSPAGPPSRISIDCRITSTSPLTITCTITWKAASGPAEATNLNSSKSNAAKNQTNNLQ